MPVYSHPPLYVLLNYQRKGQLISQRGGPKLRNQPPHLPKSQPSNQRLGPKNRIVAQENRCARKNRKPYRLTQPNNQPSNPCAGPKVNPTGLPSRTTNLQTHELAQNPTTNHHTYRRANHQTHVCWPKNRTGARKNRKPYRLTQPNNQPSNPRAGPKVNPTGLPSRTTNLQTHVLAQK